MKLALIIVFFVCALAHLYACYFELNKLRRCTKPLIMALITAIYCVLCPAPAPLVIAAFVLGLVGDVFLMFHGSGVFFMIGACSFAAGHICYLIALFTLTPLAGLTFAGVWWVALIAGAVYLAALIFVFVRLRGSLPLNKKLLLPPYMLLICIFAAGAAVGLVFTGARCFSPMQVGATLFFVSDALLCFRTYKERKKHDNFYVMLTYIAAQALIALGFIIV